jgi:hypothetical protein
MLRWRDAIVDGAFTLNSQPFALNPDHVDVVEGKAPFKPLPRAQTGCLVLFFTAFLSVGALLAFATVSEWSVLEQFKSSGIDTQAQVIERYSGNFRGIEDYFLRVRFEYNGQVYEDRVEVNARQYLRYHVGDEAAVRYLPTNPRILSVDWDGNVDTSFQRILTVCTVIWNMTILALLGFMVVQYRMLLRLAVGGTLLTGEITQASGCSDEVDNYKLTVLYKFQSPAGTLLKGQASQTRNDLKKTPPRRGTPIFVYYRDDRTYMLL